MKKLILSLGVVALLGLASCSSTDSKIDDLEKAAKELSEARESGDVAEITKKTSEMMEIAKELKDEDLTEEQQKRIVKISSEASGFGSSSFGSDD